MTSTAVVRGGAPIARRMPRRRRRAEVVPASGDEMPPISPRLQLARGALLMVVVLSLSLFVQLVFVSSLQQSSSQERAFDRFRADLAAGVAPVGPADSSGVELALGTPVAYVEIPEIGVRQVVVEGTTSGALLAGPGHRRDTPLPGQVGTSVLLGRRAAYGGPFAEIRKLEPGDLVRVTTGQGEFEYEVLGVRFEGDPVPAPVASGSSRLVLATADGRPFLPDGVVRVDADLVGTAVGGPPRSVTAATLPDSEQAMGTDTSMLWALLLWLQALIMLSVAAVWAWHRWGRAQAWVVFVPALLLVGLAAAGQVARLLPNLT